jgi:hypothetical protein
MWKRGCSMSIRSSMNGVPIWCVYSIVYNICIGRYNDQVSFPDSKLKKKCKDKKKIYNFISKLILPLLKAINITIN